MSANSISLPFGSFVNFFRCIGTCKKEIDNGGKMFLSCLFLGAESVLNHVIRTRWRQIKRILNFMTPTSAYGHKTKNNNNNCHWARPEPANRREPVGDGNCDASAKSPWSSAHWPFSHQIICHSFVYPLFLLLKKQPAAKGKRIISIVWRVGPVLHTCSRSGEVHR